MHILLVVLLVLLVFGMLPNWGNHSLGWGPSGVGGVLLVLFVVWLLFFGGMRHF